MRLADILKTLTILSSAFTSREETPGLPVKGAVVDGMIGGHSALELYLSKNSNYDLTNTPGGAEPSVHATAAAGIIAGVPFGKLFDSSELQMVSVALPEGPPALSGKVFVDDASLDATIKSIDWLEEEGTRIALMSLGYDYAINQTKENELKEKMAKSPILFIIAAGNEGRNITEHPMYPASFDLSNAIIVAAVDGDGNLLRESNYGNAVHIGAPGYRIKSTVPGDQYERFTGTSYSAPIAFHQIIEELIKDPSLSNKDIVDKIKNLKWITNLDPKSPDKATDIQESAVEAKTEEDIKKQHKTTKEEPVFQPTRVMVVVGGVVIFVGIAAYTYIKGQQSAKTQLVDLTKPFDRERVLIDHYGGAKAYRVRSKNTKIPYTGTLGVSAGEVGYLEIPGGTGKGKTKKKFLDEVPMDLLNKATKNGQAQPNQSFGISYEGNDLKVVHVDTQSQGVRRRK